MNHGQHRRVRRLKRAYAAQRGLLFVDGESIDQSHGNVVEGGGDRTNPGASLRLGHGAAPPVAGTGGAVHGRVLPLRWGPAHRRGEDAAPGVRVVALGALQVRGEPG